jgi:hypothetical protein
VEARIGHDLPPRVLGDQVFDGQWRRVRFERGLPGVPVKLWNHEAAHLGYLTYEAAMSLAYWFAAEADASCVEIRLVRYRFDYSFSVHHEATEEPIAHGAFRRQAAMLKPKSER